MTEQEYREVAAACDRLLRAPDTSLGRLAIPLLHLIDEHPGNLTHYASRHRILDAFRDVARIGRGLARSLVNSNNDLAHVRALGRVDVLIVSRMGNPAWLERQDDFYFGAMQRMLLERGATSALVLVSPPYPSGMPARAMRPLPAARFLLPRTVEPRIETRIWRQCLAVRTQLRQAARAANGTVDERVAMLASHQALSARTAVNLRLHATLSEICRLLDPRIVITTCEGDASERIIWHAARGEGRRPLCAGYQHTRLLERAHAIRRCLRVPGIDCDPDVLLTLGVIPHTALAASSALNSVRLIEYGSHRRAPPASVTPFDQRQRLCLVLPDADPRECALLFEFAVACAQQAPEVRFSLRPHPAMNFSVLISRHKTLRNLPHNIILPAGETLEQQCQQARYCLYRGSSAVIHAVLAGVKPFYLSRSDELPFDPLFALTECRETVASPEEFLQRARAAAPNPQAAHFASSFADRYLSGVRPEAIDELLGMAAQ